MMDGWFLGISGEYLNNSIERRMSRKYHYFEDDKSFCGKYQMVTNYYETGIESGEIAARPQIACKRCYEKWKKEFHIDG